MKPNMKIEDTPDRYKKIFYWGYEVNPVGCIESPTDKLPETLMGYDWIGGIRYDSEKKAIIKWEEEPLPEPVDEWQELKDRVKALEDKVKELEAKEIKVK